MPIPLSHELCGATRKPQDDPLELGVLALPDLEAVLKELLNVFVSRLGLENARPVAETFCMRPRTEIKLYLPQ